MRLRKATAEDMPYIREMYEGQKYVLDCPDVNDELIEEFLVAEDAIGRKMGACYAVRSVEMVMMLSPEYHPSVKMSVINYFHKEMRKSLSAKGYNHAFSVVSPKLKRYIQRMKAIFGWLEDYTAYRIPR